MTIRRWACALLTLFLTTGAGARAPAHDAASPGPQRIEFPSLDAPDGQAVMLPAWWFRAPTGGAPSRAPAPVVVMLHGCGGMLNRNGEPAERYRDYAALLNAQGWDDITPVYLEFPGWSENTHGITVWDELPPAARAYLRALEELAGCPISIVSTGPDREHTMVLQDPFA